MSEKQASINLECVDEATDRPIGVSAAVDFINPGYVYLAVDDGERCTYIAIADFAARDLAQFILNETRP